MCHKVRNLSAVVHLSTAFCYCDQEVLLEKVYVCPHEPNDLIRCAEWMDITTIDKITPNLLQPHPNTYTYSKRLAEILVEQQHPALPICIARPSIGKYKALLYHKDTHRELLTLCNTDREGCTTVRSEEVFLFPHQP